MSFILNALRKSEQERQALQSETVTDRILLHQPQQNRSKTAKFVALIILFNVLIIAYLVWSVRSSPAPASTAQAISPSVPAQETQVESKAIAKPTPPESPAQKEELQTTSIAELIDGEKPEPAPPVKPVITKKTAADTIKQPAIIDHPEVSIQAAPVMDDAAKADPEPAETTPLDIPFLSDLPYEFRQTVPKLTINVFVYSQHPEERFVMVDMVKYKPGQNIKDVMLLKEIRPDSLVVVYQNRTFQIERP